jgi:hypothetical protein
MTRKRGIILIVSIGLIGLAGVVFAQRGARGLGRPPQSVVNNGVREMPPADRKGMPEWEIDPHFKSNVFTFARIDYNTRNSNGGWREPWMTDYPDSDLNFSMRLQQLTSIQVNPRPVILQLTDDALFDYPFIYMLEVQRLDFSEQDMTNLRRYLLNGGFLMVDDSWDWSGAWVNFEPQMKRVFPDITPVELQLDHPIFHCVFDLKQKPQVPGIDWARANGPTSTSEHGSGPSHYYGWFDSKGRMMILFCRNTDLGDGWEREGEEEWYFHQYSEKQAYPMGINIVFYAMSH